MPVKTAPDLRLILSSTADFAPKTPYSARTSPIFLPMRAIPLSSLSIFGFYRPIALPDHTYLRPLPGSLHLPPPFRRRRLSSFPSACSSSDSSSSRAVIDAADLSDSENEGFDFQENSEFRSGNDAENFDAPRLEVKELEELPEQWRRSKIAWLCRELPTQKHGTLVRILNAQRKWLKQEEATYVAVHCMRIREHETGFKVYQWMVRQSWYKFDFALATKLADYMGREGKYAKCREIFDDIIKQGQVPSESTFHNLIVAYLGAPVQGCLDEACGIYNQMVQSGVHVPRLDLHNSLFNALVSNSGGSSKDYLKQAELIFCNLVTSGVEVPKEIYSGLIWMHSNQDTVDKARISELRDEMRNVGFEEGKEVLVSVLRACAKERDVEEAETTWIKLCASESSVPSEAFVLKMEIYAKVGEFMKSLEVFREMEKNLGSASVAAYQKIIEVLCKAQDVELAESLMKEVIESGKNPMMQSYVDLTSMYLDLSLHDKLELAFSECLGKCQPNSAVYNNYLTSLVRAGNLGKAEEIFNQMHADGTIGINSQSCNTILSGYLSSGDFEKAKRIYDLMCQKRYDIDSGLMEKLDSVLSSSRKMVKEPLRPKLSKEQREILVGLLLGGLQVVSDEKRRKHLVQFEFNQNSVVHSVLRRHIHDQFHEWLHRSSKPDNEDIPYKFYTIAHPYFSFYADQFWPGGQPKIPKLIHRWLSPKALAYWFMYGGHRTSSGDIILKIKGSEDDIEKIVETFREKSVECKVKKKGRVFWIGFLGHNSTLFWKIVEPHIPDELKDSLNADYNCSK